MMSSRKKTIMDAPEVSAMRVCNKELINGLAAENVDSVADELRSVLLLSDEDYGGLLELSKTRHTKAREVVWKVSLKVKANPKDKFNKFLEILRHYHGLQDLVKTLEAKHGEFVGACSSGDEMNTEASTSSEESHISQDVLGQVVKLETEFSRLTLSLLQKLKRDNVSVDYLTSIISSVPGDVKVYVYDSWLKIVEQCPFKSLDVLFTKLNADVWTFLDYYLVHHIISKLGSGILICEMNAYIISVQKFKERTRVREFIDCWKGHPRNIPDYQKVEIKLADSNITLSELDDLREGLKRNFFPSLSNCAACVYYGHFDPGCCIVTLLFPFLLVKMFRASIEDCNLFVEFKVSYISVDDVPVYGRHLQSQQSVQVGMFGILADVSGSMQSTFALDSNRDASVERTHAIITSIINVVRSEVSHCNKFNKIFVSAFGLNASVSTCDLVALLDIITGPYGLKGKVGHDALVALASKNGAHYAERWIKEHLTKEQAEELFKILCFDETLIPKLLEKLPHERQLAILEGVSSYIPGGSFVKGFAVHQSEAYCYANEIIKDKESILNGAFSKIEHSKPRSIQFVSELLNDLNLKDDYSSRNVSSKSLHGCITKLIFAMKPYIYGGTPMCKAMKEASGIFGKSKAKSNVLFIVSDGQSGDGNPQQIADHLKKFDVVIVTCYLTNEHISNQKKLLYKAPLTLENGPRTMFEMSSIMRNIDPPISYLIDTKWDLPASGESRLFVQANSLDVVDEFCKVVVSQLANPCDGLVDFLNEVDVTNYINSLNAMFEPKKQIGGASYANAMATVIHLAMHRIVSRKGGYPAFDKILDMLILEYGKPSANARKILERVCSEYCLHSREVDELHARQALNERRPLLATFSLFAEQWIHFREYFDKNPKGIIQRCDIKGGHNNPKEHAVVLIRCSPKCLVFMNSWGQDWADGGFFRVKDASVLNDMKFYDVYWTEKYLTSSEKEVKTLRNPLYLHDQFSSVGELLFMCPLCHKNSKIGQYGENSFKARCPQCNGKFKPMNEDFAKALYLKNM